MSSRIPSMDATANERPAKPHPRRFTNGGGLAHFAEGFGENIQTTPPRSPGPPPEDTRSLTARICGDPIPGHHKR